jgi:hypothetical protein
VLCGPIRLIGLCVCFGRASTLKAHFLEVVSAGEAVVYL